MKQTFSFMAGAFCGALAGAVIALLLAPMSGEKLQTEARGQFDQVVHDARAAADAKRTQLEAQLAALKRPPQPVEEPAGESPAEA